MIIWTGYGFIVFIIVFVNTFLTELISEAVTHDDKFYQNNLIPMGISFIISGLVIYVLKEYFDKKKATNQGTRIFDKVTIAKEGHHLFFIPFKYWSYILIILGIAVIIYQFVR